MPRIAQADDFIPVIEKTQPPSKDGQPSKGQILGDKGEGIAGASEMQTKTVYLTEETLKQNTQTAW